MRKIFLYSQWPIQDFLGGNVPTPQMSHIPIQYLHMSDRLSGFVSSWKTFLSPFRSHNETFKWAPFPFCNKGSGKFKCNINKKAFRSKSNRPLCGLHMEGGGVPHEVWRAFQPYHQILSMLKHVRCVKGRNNLWHLRHAGKLWAKMCLGYHTTAQFHMIGRTTGGGGPKWTSLNRR